MDFFCLILCFSNIHTCCCFSNDIASPIETANQALPTPQNKSPSTSVYTRTSPGPTDASDSFATAPSLVKLCPRGGASGMGERNPKRVSRRSRWANKELKNTFLCGASVWTDLRPTGGHTMGGHTMGRRQVSGMPRPKSSGGHKNMKTTSWQKRDNGANMKQLPLQHHVFAWP